MRRLSQHEFFMFQQDSDRTHPEHNTIVFQGQESVEFYLYPTVGTVLIHSVKPELTE